MAEVPLVVVACLQIANGWVPTSDDAVIAWRTWNVFSLHAPLVGQYTQISGTSGHAAFDPGPLQYFLLAVPDRFDPVHGVLWGSALLCAAVVALAIEAAWATGRVVAGVSTACGAAVLTATLVESTVNLAWNPSLGVFALFATLVLSAAAGSGRLRWLPFAVVTASVAAQCHVSFAAAAIGSVIVGLGTGVLVRLVDRATVPWRPLVAALGVGVLCWVAPLVQQLTGHPGNWTVLAGHLRDEGHRVGIDTGLRAIGSATHVPPSWWQRPPPLVSWHFATVIYGGSPAWGVAALAVAAGIAVGAFVARRRGLASLAAVSAVAGAAVAWTLGSVPTRRFFYLFYYLYFAVWPVGMALAASILGALAMALVAAARRIRPFKDLHAPIGARRKQCTAVGAVALLGFGGWLLALDVPIGSSGTFLVGWQPVRDVVSATALIERHAPRNEFTVVAVGRSRVVDQAVSDGVAYALVTRGYPARLVGLGALQVGPSANARAGSPEVVIHLGPTSSKAPPRIEWRAASPRSRTP